MIEADTLFALAVARRPVLVTVPVRPGATHHVHQLIRPLWPEPTGSTFGWWRILVQQAGVWRVGLLLPAEAVLINANEDAERLPPIDISAPASRSDALRMLEAACVTARFRLHVEFSYRKDGHPVEQRRGVAVGLAGDLLRVEDADRAGQLRSFALDRIGTLRAVGESPPVWNGRDYARPSDPKPWGDDPFSGHGEGEE